eukprot:c17357_g1_i2.p1 GENE.c17357_g1_i2~~c17357_g1_i2.p1  ORF type:complete len:106 (+),score=21.03 c17357_g1_i2:405-722(+)
MLAVRWSRVEAAALLMRAGAIMTFRDENGLTPKAYAARNKHGDNLQVILDFEGEQIRKRIRAFLLGTHPRLGCRMVRELPADMLELIAQTVVVNVEQDPDLLVPF